MDLFNKKKVSRLEVRIKSLTSDLKCKDNKIDRLRKELSPYVTVAYNGFYYYNKRTLKDAEREILELKLYASVLEGELGQEKTESAKNKFDALKKLTNNMDKK